MTTILFSYTGTGINIVRQNSPTIITPTIASLINVQHNHQSAVGGGSLDAAAIASGLLALARGGLAADLSGTGGSNQFLKQTSSGAAVSVAAILSADLTTALTTPPPIGFTTPNSAVFSTATVQGAITAKTTDAATNTIVHALVPSHRSSGTPTTNFGVDIDFQADSSTNTQRDLAFIEANWLTATDASREARLNFYVNNTVKVQVMTMRPSVITALVAFAGTSASLSSALTLSGAPGLVQPAADSTNALGFANAAGTQWIVLDTTNKRILLNGTASPQNELQVLGSIGITSSSETGSTARGIQEVPSTSSSSTPHQIRGFGNVPGIQIGAWNTTGGVAQSSILIAPTNISLSTNATSSAGVERLNIADALALFSVSTSVKISDSSANTVVDGLIISHNTSATPAGNSSFGSDIRFRGQSTTTADREMARIRTFWIDATDATRTSSLVFSIQNAGVELDAMQIISNQLVMGVGVVFFPAQAATVSAPSYAKGGMYFDTTLNKLRIGGASGWETVTSV